MLSIILIRKEPRYYVAQNHFDRNSQLIPIVLLANDMGPSLPLYIENLKNNTVIDTERSYSHLENNFVILTDRFAEQDGVLNQLVISRENLINVLEKWRKFSTQKTNEIILTHHDDGTVSIDGK